MPFNPNFSITSFIKLIRLFKESNRTIFICGNAIFNGIPGKPAPVPKSKTFIPSSISTAYTNDKLSRKCF